MLGCLLQRTPACNELFVAYFQCRNTQFEWYQSDGSLHVFSCKTGQFQMQELYLFSDQLSFENAISLLNYYMLCVTFEIL